MQAYLKGQVTQGVITMAEYVRFSQQLASETGQDKENVPPEDGNDAGEEEDEDPVCLEDDEEVEDYDLRSVDPGSSAGSSGNIPSAATSEEEDRAEQSRKRARDAVDFWKEHLPAKAPNNKPRVVPKLPPKAVPSLAGSRRSNGQRRDDVSVATMKERVDMFPGEGLRLLNNTIHCKGCFCTVSSAITALRRHCQTRKHIARKNRIEKAQDNRDVLLQSIKVWKQENATNGDRLAQLEQVCDNDQTFRAEVLEVYMKTGVPLQIIDAHRPFLESLRGGTLTQASKLMAVYLPPLQLKEATTVRNEFKSGLFVGWVVDGTWLQGEVIAQTGQFMGPDMVPQSRLACAHWLAQSVHNRALAAQIAFGVTERGSISLDNVLSLTTDAAATNPAAWNNTLRDIMVYCDFNLCFVHGGSGACSKADTSLQLDSFKTKFFGLLGKSGLAAGIWTRIVGEAAATRNNIRFVLLWLIMLMVQFVLFLQMMLMFMLISVRAVCVVGVVRVVVADYADAHAGFRFFSDVDALEKSVLPNLHNGKMLQWAMECQRSECGDRSIAGILAILCNPRKRTILHLEAVALVYGCKTLQASSTFLEGDSYTFMQAYPRIMEAMNSLQHPLTEELMGELHMIAAKAPAPAATAAPSIQDKIVGTTRDPRMMKLCAMPSIQGVRVSCSSTWWQEAMDNNERRSGTIIGWAFQECKLSIDWDKLGETIPQMSGVLVQETLLDQSNDTPFLLDPKFNFTLDRYSNGASIIVPPLPVVAPVFVLSQQDLRSIEVLKAHVKRILAPCVTHYQNLLATREEQLFRMKAAQICDPLFAKANPVTVEQINNLNVFRFAAHPILATNIEGMKNELSRYKAAVDAIPPVEQRLVSKIVTKQGKKTTMQVDTFNIAKWWQEQSGTLASFALVVRAICCQSSSSCSAERVFSILNDTFTEDQRNSRADYMELSLQLQYNNRGRV